LNETISAAGSTLDVERGRLNVVLRRWLLPILTGVLMALAFPPFNFSQLAWISLVPLLFALEKCRRGEAFRRGYVAGLVFFAMTIWWIRYVTLPGTVGMIAFLALYFGAAGAWFAIVDAKLLRGGSEPRMGFAATTADSATRNILVSLIASAGWVTLEWLRGKLVFGGFPFNFLGVSQWRAGPLIQFASVTGVYGVSALLCFVNFAFYFTIRRFIRQACRGGAGFRLSWELYVAMGLIGLTLMHGVRVMIHRDRKPVRTMRLALVQGDIPQTLKFEPEEKPMILERYRTLTEAVLAVHPEMIIWPETATPEPLRYDPDSFGLVTNLAVRSGAYLLTGTIDATPYSAPVEAYNAAILVGPDGTLRETYRKIHLVAFGEYVPLRKIFPFLKWLTPIGDSFERGREFTVFRAGEMRFGVVICFEDAVPDLVRCFVRRGVDFMVNVTNDAWFKTSPAAEMHLANAVFRAVENRRPLVRATNNGMTCVIDEYGRIQPNARLAPFARGMMVYELPVPRESGLTIYAQHGDWVVGVAAGLAGLVAFCSRRKLTLVQPPEGG
jgi:apolipoprotein N-acyltransferase